MLSDFLASEEKKRNKVPWSQPSNILANLLILNDFVIFYTLEFCSLGIFEHWENIFDVLRQLLSVDNFYYFSSFGICILLRSVFSYKQIKCK